MTAKINRIIYIVMIDVILTIKERSVLKALAFLVVAGTDGDYYY